MFNRYSLDRSEDTLSITLDLILCIDSICNTIPVFSEVGLPKPVCNVDYSTFTLPGDGSVAGFVEYLDGNVGEFATEIVLKKYGLEVNLNVKKSGYYYCTG